MSIYCVYLAYSFILLYYVYLSYISIYHHIYLYVLCVSDFYLSPNYLYVLCVPGLYLEPSLCIVCIWLVPLT